MTSKRPAPPPPGPPNHHAPLPPDFPQPFTPSLPGTRFPDSSPPPPLPGTLLRTTESSPPPLPGTLSRVPQHNISHTSMSGQTSSTSSFPSDDSTSTLNRRIDDYTLLPYFYSNFSNPNEVAEFLKHRSKGKHGYFVVRPSFRNPKTQLTVSVTVSDKSVRHTNIVIERHGLFNHYYLVKEKKFETVEDLISYYKQNEVKNLQNVKNVRFTYPVPARRSARSHSQTESGSASSGNSNGPYNYVGSSGIVDSPPQERPPLPERPKDLPKLDSLGSPTSGFTSSPSASGPSFDTSNDMDLPHEAAGSQMSLVNSDTRLKTFPSMTSIDVESRPPAPLPMVHSEKNPYYSTPRNVNEDMSGRLKEVLKQSEKCDCGIPRDMSELPLGWTIHRSKDKATYGRIFYQSSKGFTSWKLPDDVQRKLNATHKANLNKLNHMQQAAKLSFSSYIDNTQSHVHASKNSGSGGNSASRISGSSGSGGQTSGAVEPKIRITHITQF